MPKLCKYATLKGPLANNAETIEGGGQAGINSEITNSRTLNELGIKLKARSNASRGSATLAVKYPLLFSSLWPKLAVTKVQNPIIRTIETIRGTDWSGGTSVQWPSCTDRDLTFDVTYQDSNLTVGPNMRSEFLAGGFQPYATMRILQSTPKRITVRYSFSNVPTGQWYPSGGISFWLRDVNDPNNHWAGRPPVITLPRPSECSSRADHSGVVGGIVIVKPPPRTGLKPTVPNPTEPSNDASCVGFGAPPLDQTVVFHWEAAENVTTDFPYEVQVKQANANCPTNPTFSEPPSCHLDVAKTTETALGLAADKDYAWRVRGVNKDSQRQRIYGDWSNWQNFRTRGPVEAPVTISSVSNYCFPPVPPGPVITGASVQLQWQASPCGNALYEYRVFHQDRLNPWITGNTSLTQATVTLRIDPPPPPRNDSGDRSSEDQSSEDQPSKKTQKKPRTVSYSWQVRATVPWGTSEWSPLQSIRLGDCQ